MLRWFWFESTDFKTNEFKVKYFDKIKWSKSSCERETSTLNNIMYRSLDWILCKLNNELFIFRSPWQVGNVKTFNEQTGFNYFVHNVCIIIYKFVFYKGKKTYGLTLSHDTKPISREPLKANSMDWQPHPLTMSVMVLTCTCWFPWTPDQNYQSRT